MPPVQLILLQRLLPITVATILLTLTTKTTMTTTPVMQVGRLCQASEGVKEKPLCWHFLLCQHLPSCSYSTSPFVRPSTKVSLLSHASVRICVSALIVFVPRNIIENPNRRVSSYENSKSSVSFIYIFHATCWQSIHMVPPNPIHVLHSIYTATFEEQSKNNKEWQKNKKKSSHSIVALSFDDSHFILVHVCMISQLINNQFLQV